MDLLQNAIPEVDPEALLQAKQEANEEKASQEALSQVVSPDMGRVKVGSREQRKPESAAAKPEVLLPVPGAAPAVPAKVPDEEAWNSESLQTAPKTPQMLELAPQPISSGANVEPIPLADVPWEELENMGLGPTHPTGPTQTQEVASNPSLGEGTGQDLMMQQLTAFADAFGDVKPLFPSSNCCHVTCSRL